LGDEMIKKIIFVIVFVPVHLALTAYCVIRWLNWNYRVDTGLWPRFINLCARILSLPLFLPLLMFDVEGNRTPRWLGVVELFANSIVWAVLILLVIAATKHFRNRKRSQRTPNQTIDGD